MNIINGKASTEILDPVSPSYVLFTKIMYVQFMFFLLSRYFLRLYFLEIHLGNVPTYEIKINKNLEQNKGYGEEE